jgi:hypothetical protein
VTVCADADGTPDARRGYSLSVSVIDTPEQTVDHLVRWRVDTSRVAPHSLVPGGIRFPHDGQTVTVGE